MKHFPFLFFILLFFSCQDTENSTNEKTYKQLITKAIFYRDTVINLDSAYSYFNKAKLNTSKSQADRMVYLLGEIAKIQKEKGDYSGSEETATEAFQFFSNIKDSVYIYSVYSSLGTTYQRLLDYENAIKFYDLCLKGKIADKDKNTMLNNIAVIYLNKGDYRKAIEILEAILSNKKSNFDKTEYARIIDNLGFSYFKNSKKEKGYSLLKQSLRIKDSIGDEYQKIAPLMHLALFFMDSITSESNKFARNAYDIASKVNSPDDRLEALDILIRNTSNREEFKYYYEKFSSLKDSIEFVRQTAKNQFANIKYNFRIAKEESENLKKQKIIYLLLFALSVLVAGIVIYIIRKRNRERVKKIAYDTETRISKSLHDELANKVFNTMTFIDTHDLQNPSHKETVLQDLDTIYGKTRNISKQNSEIKTGKEFTKSLNQLFSSYKSEEVNIMIQGLETIAWEKIKENKQIEIYRVLCELLVNMKKHSKANLVVFRFENYQKEIHIKYSDNGIGFEKDKIFKNGILNVENRILGIKGNVTFDTQRNKGLKVSIELPKK